jgi:hypothetical protein
VRCARGHREHPGPAEPVQPANGVRAIISGAISPRGEQLQAENIPLALSLPAMCAAETWRAPITEVP